MFSWPSCLWHSCQSRYILFADLKMEQIHILFHPLHRRWFRKRNDIILKQKSQTQLRRWNLILSGKFKDQSIFQNPPSSDRAPCLHLNTMLFTILHSCLLHITRMQFQLIDNWFYSSILQNVLNMVRKEVAESKSPDLPFFLKFFHRPPGLKIQFFPVLTVSRRSWPVDQIDVQIIGTKSFQTLF